ncbi:MAG: hypothetical protein FJ384_09550 [Verrucomicrobia bacterium]|nr:hypothetical protein [Verrucomicrobiota bacterium]
MAAALLLGLTGCDEEIGVASRRLEKPPAKGDNDYGSAVYLGHPGEQKLHWSYWRHRWSVEFTGSQGRFVAQPDTQTAPAQPPGPGMTDSDGTEINPGWENACGDQGAAGHLLCQYERGDLLVGVIEQRAGRICLAVSRDRGRSFVFTDLGANEQLREYAKHSTFRQLARSVVTIDAQGIACLVLGWETELLTGNLKPGFDSSKLPPEQLGGWTIECLTLSPKGLRRQSLKDWDDREFAKSLRITPAEGGFWVAASGRQVYAWEVSAIGEPGRMLKLPDSGTAGAAEIVSGPRGTFVAWNDHRRSRRVGFPGPWELPRSKHAQIAVCPLRGDQAGPTVLITPRDHCAYSLAAGSTAEGPSLCWRQQRIDPADVTQLDKNSPAELHEHTLTKPLR